MFFKPKPKLAPVDPLALNEAEVEVQEIMKLLRDKAQTKQPSISPWFNSKDGSIYVADAITSDPSAKDSSSDRVIVAIRSSVGQRLYSPIGLTFAEVDVLVDRLQNAVKVAKEKRAQKCM